MAGAIFGLAFGFLLQKGGVGKFNVLIGQLLLQDFTVPKPSAQSLALRPCEGREPWPGGRPWNSPPKVSAL
jgi:hypothetical protein